MSKRNTVIYLVLIICLGFLIRFAGINYGLPNPGYFSSDEIDNVSKALKFSTGSFRPHHFSKPTFYNLLLFFQYGASYIFLRLTGALSSLREYESLFFNNPTIFYYLARLTSALSGTLIILLAFLIGKRVRDKETGILASLLVAFSLVSVKYSHIAKADALVALLFNVSLYWLLVMVRANRITYYLLAGLFMGLALSTKYSSIAIFIPFLVTHLIASSRCYQEAMPIKRYGLIDYKFYAALVMIIIGFSLGTPYFALHPVDFFHQLSLKEVAGMKTILGYEEQYGLRFLLAILLKEFGYIGLLTVLIGVGAAFFYKTAENYICLSLIIGYLAMLLMTKHLDYQYIMPLTPVLCVFAAQLLRRQRLFWPVITSIIVLAIVLPQFFQAARYDKELLGIDTRQQAGTWIKDNIPQSSRLLIDSSFYFRYYPSLQFNRKTYERLYQGQLASVGEALYFKRALEYTLPAIGYDVEFMDINVVMHEGKAPEQKINDLDYYRDEGIDYVIVSSYFYERFFNYQGKGFEKVKAFYNALDTECKLVKEFSPTPGVNAGPVLKIYALRP